MEEIQGLEDSEPTISHKRNANLLVVDAEVLVRHAICMLIDSLEGYTVVAQATQSNEAVSILEKHDIDLLITEIVLPGVSGIDLLHELSRKEYKTKAIVLSQVDSPDMVKQALLAGASGYVFKNSTLEEFLTALEVVMTSHKRYLPPELAELAQIPDNLYEIGEDAKPSDPLHELSPREREIFHLLASGFQNTIIAKRLLISPRTVETHRARITRKLGLHTNGELIRFAIKNGLSVP